MVRFEQQFKSRYRWIRRQNRGLFAVQNRRVAGGGVGYGGQVVSQADVGGKFTRDLPRVVDEEAVAPCPHATTKLRPWSGHGLWKTEQEIGRSVTGQLAVKAENAAWAVHRCPPGGQAAQFAPETDVMRLT